MRNILAQYGFEETDCIIRPFGNGLINHTWMMEAKGQRFILQKINQQVFTSPEAIAFNIHLVADHLKKNYPDYLFVVPLQTADGRSMVGSDDGYFRIFPFIEGSHTIDVPEDASQAYEAA